MMTMTSFFRIRKQEAEAEGVGGEAEDEEPTEEQLRVGRQIRRSRQPARDPRPGDECRSQQQHDSRVCILTAHEKRE